MKATTYVVSERCGTEFEAPRFFKTLENAKAFIRSAIADDVRSDFFTELKEEGINEEDVEAVLNYGIEHDYCSEDCYMYSYDWHEFRTDKAELDLDEDLVIEEEEERYR